MYNGKRPTTLSGQQSILSWTHKRCAHLHALSAVNQWPLSRPRPTKVDALSMPAADRRLCCHLCACFLHKLIDLYFNCTIYFVIGHLLKQKHHLLLARADSVRPITHKRDRHTNYWLIDVFKRMWTQCFPLSNQLAIRFCRLFVVYRERVGTVEGQKWASLQQYWAKLETSGHKEQSEE